VKPGGATTAQPCCLCHMHYDIYTLHSPTSVRIRFSLHYPRLVGVSSIDRGRVESCARWIYWDPVDFRVSWCGFRLVSSNIWLLSLATVASLVRWSFRILTWQLSICLTVRLQGWARWLSCTVTQYMLHLYSTIYVPFRLVVAVYFFFLTCSLNS
jgi:hypothetical protein